MSTSPGRNLRVVPFVKFVLFHWVATAENGDAGLEAKCCTPETIVRAYALVVFSILRKSVAKTKAPGGCGVRLQNVHVRKGRRLRPRSAIGRKGGAPGHQIQARKNNASWLNHYDTHTSAHDSAEAACGGVCRADSRCVLGTA